MTDRVQYFLEGEELLASVKSSIVPEVDDLVLIDDTEYQVYHTTHTIDGGHIATVFVWVVTDDRESHIETMVERTLRNQRQKHEEWNRD